MAADLASALAVDEVSGGILVRRAGAQVGVVLVGNRRRRGYRTDRYRDHDGTAAKYNKGFHHYRPPASARRY
jgi:hypothetical protein